MSLAHLRELVNEMGGKLARKRADGQYISTSNAKRRKKMAVATRRVRCAMPPPACRNRMCTRRNSSRRRLLSLVLLFVRLGSVGLVFLALVGVAVANGFALCAAGARSWA